MVGKVTTIVEVLILIAVFSDLSDTARNEFIVPPNTGCACTGTVLTYTCTAVGTGNTLWTGTAFQCPANGIILRHERFTESGGAVGECNDGGIEGRSVRVENSCYTSQIDIVVNAIFNNKSVECIHNSGIGINTIGTSVITVMEAPYSPPNNIRLTDVSQEMLTFSWDSLGPNCTSVIYGISSSCGSCGPTSTNATIVNCSDFGLSSNLSTCNFSVNSLICGDTGPSSTIAVMLKVPDIPRATIIPSYFINQTLIKTTFMLYQETSFDIADGISGAVLTYDIHLNSDSPVNNSACGDNICEYEIDLPPSICRSSDVINVTVSATNRLGEGPRSNPTMIECTNQFVKVKHNTAASTVSCVFLNELDSSEKSCSIQYGICDKKLTESVAANATSGNVIIELTMAVSGSTYCYIVTARNRTYTVMIDGRIDIDGMPSVVGIVVPVVIITILVIVVCLIFLVVLPIILRKQNVIYKLKAACANLNMKSIEKRFTDDDLSDLKLKAVDKNEWIITKYEVDSDCSLKEFVEKCKLIFKRGCVFYEFKNEVESISKDKQLIFVENDTQKCFNPEADSEELSEKLLIGERVLKPSLSKHKVFIQSTGLGARHVAAGSAILYVKQMSHPLWIVDKTQFEEVEVDETCTLESFCMKQQLDCTKYSMYIERDDYHMVQKIYDVILMDKDTNKFLTGPLVHRIIKKSAKDDVDQQWRVFLLLSGYDKEFCLKKDQRILYKLREEHRQKQQQKHNRKQQPPQSNTSVMESPLIRISPEQFSTRQLEENYILSKFRRLPSVNLDPNEMDDIFVEIGKTNLDGKHILDMILMDKDTKEFYTGRSSWDETKKYTSSGKNAEPRKFRAFVLYKFEEDLLLLKNSWVLYRDEHIQDVLLMDHLSSQLFTYPCARRMVRKQLTDDEGKIREEIQKKWRVFVLSKPQKDFVFEEATSIFCQDPNYLIEEYHVLKVDKNNVRMSDFIRRKIGSFENGKTFYEFMEAQDLPYYKEVVHLPLDVYNNRMVSVADKELQCTCRSSIELFYKIPGLPGFEIKPPPSSGFKIFVQSRSQGSRCLKIGMVLLYKKCQVAIHFEK